MFFWWAACRSFWALFFFVFCVFGFFFVFFRKKTNKNTGKTQGSPPEKKEVQKPRSPGPPAAQPPLTLHWRNLVPVETILCKIPVVPGQAGGGSFQKEKNYIAKKEFAYRMRARRPTSAMPKSFLCLRSASAVPWW